MLLNVKRLSQVEARKLMMVYEESNVGNNKCFFPDNKDISKGKKAEEEKFLDYLSNDFFKLDNSVLYVWEEDKIWVSALRLYKINEKLYFLEALETHPGYRRKGYGKKLIDNLIEELKQNGNFILKSYVYENNIASLNTHLRCGFVEEEDRAFDYVDESYVDNSISLAFKYGV
ncbi:GNAT family N-acetyltransferase [Clostridium sp. YIM B02505]|uniref:GNAT family N-acetyltransferase n=1 Tax=Clostridium yunnanense TaxID=2800325 RepID=A0ABS1EN08_9CLOT|nr:GNAT family N-acetyltransferase [Clostridium yunnanense]MBK1810752.1 GNAT family N-acetyltransferase [Clostridium yunnanense]